MALPHNPLPANRFHHPEDAEWQISEGLKYFAEIFGKKPKGMWPSEGSVSRQAAELIQQNGIEWIATDQDVLKYSLGLKGRPTDWSLADYELFSPWQITFGKNKTLNMVFRDHNLSDAIGFRYSGWGAVAAANDLVNILKGIQQSIPADKEPYLLNIILDGENAWEYFPNNGWDFLTALYSKLSEETNIVTTTVSEYIKKYPPKNILPELFSGSWIDHNFFVWIGYEKANKAWSYLKETRDALKNASDLLERNGLLKAKTIQENIAKAWQEIHIAEGSDWFWWYSDFHSSALDLEFDKQFRQHLQNVYALLKLDAPEHLSEPLAVMPTFKAWQPATSFISPGLVGDPDHWQGAGIYDPELEPAGTMAQVAHKVIKKIFVGRNDDHLYLRIDPDRLDHPDHSYTIYIDNRYEVWIHPSNHHFIARFFRKERSGQRIPLENSLHFHADRFFELMIPLANLAFPKEQTAISIKVCLSEENQLLEQWPAQDLIRFELRAE
jgi:hypothetical protein